MTRKHQSPEYQRNARTLRSRTRSQLAVGAQVRCWRCGRPIVAGQPFDIGHISPHGGEGLHNLAAEHRTKTGGCEGNRNNGGRVGATITNSRRTKHGRSDVETWGI